MKRILSVLIAGIITVSMFSVSFVSYAEATVAVTFHSNNQCAEDVFKTVNVSDGSSVASFYELPDVPNRFVFKGWYYGRSSDAEKVDFENDTFTDDTDIFAQWADNGVCSPDSADSNRYGRGSYDDFDLAGVQVKAGDVTDAQNGGLRFISSLSNDLLAQLDSLSDNTIGENQNRVEYGFIAAKKTTVEDWIAFAQSKGADLSGYKLSYNGTNVNGVDTTLHNTDYQGFVTNIDCTASDYGTGNVKDFKKYKDYRLYTVAITYADAQDYTSSDLVVRSYLRYYDKNGLLRTVCDDYDGTDSYGGISTSYDEVDNLSYITGSYSTLGAMLSDAANLTVEHGTSSDPVCSMYISGGTAYMKLLKNVSLGGNTTITNKADLNLNGFTVNAGNYSLITTNAFNMYNGSYTVGTQGNYIARHSGDLTRVSNVAYSARNIGSAMFRGVMVNGNISYFTDCSFDFTTGSTCSTLAVALFSGSENGAEYARLSGCRFNVEVSEGLTVGVFNSGSSIDINDCNVALTGSSDRNVSDTSDTEHHIAYDIVTIDSKSTVVRDSALSVAGDADASSGGDFREPTGICAYRNNSGTNNFFEADNVDIKINVDDFYDDLKTVNSNTGETEVVASALSSGIDFRDVEQAVLKNVAINTKVKSSDKVNVQGIYSKKETNMSVSGIDIDIINTSGVEDAYRLYGIYLSGNSEMLMTSGDIRVPIALEHVNKDVFERNVAVSANGNSSVTFTPDSDEDIFIQGGNAALNSSKDAKYTIYGGKYCSPSHGGAYFGGDADIFGGEYYGYIVSGHEQHGGMYVTHNAVVNIRNAKITGYINGLRTRDNTPPGTPTVNVYDTVIEAVNAGVSCSAGTIHLYDGTVINCQNATEGNVIDHRTVV